MTKLEAIKARHAVRNYTMKSLSPTIIDGLKEEIERCNRMGQLHIKLVTKNEGHLKTSFHYFGGLKMQKTIFLW